jgi:Resolvase, N terminal domain
MPLKPISRPLRNAVSRRLTPYSQYTTPFSKPPVEWVRATHPHHPLHGQRVQLIRVRRGRDPDCIIRMPDGYHGAIAASLIHYGGPQRAHDLGWEQAAIQVIDQDQGQSGSSSIGRDRFQVLVAEVGLGHVGAVLSLEVSRLARSCSGWYRRLQICALTDTPVIDEEGVYDPGLYNDRLLLGFYVRYHQHLL